MELILGTIIGALLVLVLKDKAIKIEVLHKHEQHQVEIPDMDSVLKGDKPEDTTYSDMGAMLDSINEIMTGGKSNGKE